MKLVNYIKAGQVRLGFAKGSLIYDLADSAKNTGLVNAAGFHSVDEVLGSGGLDLCKEVESKGSMEGGLPLGETKLMSPVLSPEKILCVAVNYVSHGNEQKTPPPAEPYLFTKFRNALTAHEQPIIIPRMSKKVDWEVELSVIIGKTGKYVPRERAMEMVAGYSVSNDISFRDLQLPPGWPEKSSPLGQNWLKGKGLDTAFPFGPWLVTKDEIDDPYALELSLKVNGDLRQKSKAGEMVFKIDQLIEYISAGITLKPGDVISTGTPAGIALFTGQPFLKDGDVVEASISKIGTLRNYLRACDDSVS